MQIKFKLKQVHSDSRKKNFTLMLPTYLSTHANPGKPLARLAHAV